MATGVERSKGLPVLRDYSVVTPDAVRADLASGLADADRRIEALLGEPPADAFAVVAALDDVEADVVALHGRTAFLDLVHPDQGVREAAGEARARIAGWQAGLPLRGDVANLVAGLPVAEPGAPEGTADGEAAGLLARWQCDVRRGGHGLSDEVCDEVRALRDRLARIEAAYEKNVSDHDDGIDVTRADLDGLPDDWIDRLSVSATAGAGPGTLRVSLAYPELFPFLEQARRRDLRRELAIRWWSRAASVNRPLLEEGLEVRRRLASLLGYTSWADYATEVRMAGSAARVDAFLDDLAEAVAPAWARELTGLHALLLEDRSVDGADTAEATDEAVQVWDVEYLLRVRRERRVGMDPSELAAYFPIDRVLQVMFEVMGTLFVLDIAAVPDASAWYSDVAVYAVSDRGTGDLLGYVYLDLFARAGKFSHAAAFPLTRPRDLPRGRDVAVSALVTNFSPQEDGRPSLLRHDELLTLFHEFGHIVHHMVTHTRFVKFSGTSVEKDFVEAPSQLMERWAWDREVLERIARHHRTGQPPPAGTLERLTSTRFDRALVDLTFTVWLSRVDLDAHTAVDTPPDLDWVMRARFTSTQLPYPSDTFLLAGLGHLFGGYDAGYYSYLWAEVIGDAMVARFEREGLLNPQVGAAFRTAVLEPGGSFDGNALVERFLARPAELRAFLAARGWDVSTPAGAGGD